MTKKQPKDTCDYKSILIFDHDKHMGTIDFAPDGYKKILDRCQRDGINVIDFLHNLILKAIKEESKETKPSEDIRI